MKQQTERDALRKLAEAATNGHWESYETRVYLPNLLGGFDIRNSPNAAPNAAYIAATHPAKVIELLDALEAQAQRIAGLEQDRDFYLRRVELLQTWQSKMRDPERTICCDIIANGQTLPPENAGDRYTIAPVAPAQPVNAELVAVVEQAVSTYKALHMPDSPYLARAVKALANAKAAQQLTKEQIAQVLKVLLYYRYGVPLEQHSHMADLRVDEAISIMKGAQDENA